MTIVAFTGKRKHGKDTAAKTLRDAGFVQLSFADALREIVHIAYDISMEEMLDPVIKDRPLDRYPFKSPREILTSIGTQGFRDLIADDTWVRVLERRAHGHRNVVIADLRFKNEEKMLIQNDACIIRVIDPRRTDDEPFAQHRSEMEMDLIIPDFTIINDSTVEHLHKQVWDCVMKFEDDGK